ncbi:uncharacterized protein B0H18DRAFT_109630 [Fomitopsis serialis]|uniref:uncharacterized protein n=1 Tax=Fomitopsis serialis TaxID=139415 RepID=UPI00200859D3|nr:uncharacterized protein B0H18DRAFT_109630 [Neoantrodia serialis]KAH9915082.1 hypothetical protein B0H18DRAFT_109630 [Neoantrodia serialis]
MSVDGLQPLSPILAARIPVELHLEIIGWLACDRHSLHICAMVSRTWYPHSVHLLYEKVDIGALNTVSSMAQSAFKHERVRHNLVGTLALDLDGASEINSGRTLESALVVLASLMPSLQKLTLRQCLPCPLHTSFYAALRACKNVTDLTLCGVVLENYRVLFRVLCGFPQLRRVAFEGNLRFSHATSPSPVDSVLLRRSKHPTSCELRHLRISVSNKALVIPLVQWLVDSSLHTSIESLETRVADKHVTVLNELLQAIGPSLVHFRELVALNKKFAHLDLRHNTSLQTIELYSGHRSLTDIETVLQLTRALASVGSPRLTRIVLKCGDHPGSWKPSANVRAFDTADLIPLHAVIGRPVFDALRVVQVVVCRKRSQDVVAVMTINRLLAPWCARGIVSFI